MVVWIGARCCLLIVVAMLVACGQGTPSASSTVTVETVALNATPSSQIAQRESSHSTPVLTQLHPVGDATAGLRLSPSVPRGSGRLVVTGGMTIPRAAHTATLLGSGEVLIAGGCTRDSCEMGPEGATAELYDPDTGSFKDAGRMTTERVSHTATLLSDGQVLVAGGWDSDGVVASAELYSPHRDSFTAIKRMNEGRAGHTATVLPSGKVLIAGGYNGSRHLAGAEVYDPQKGVFTPAGDMTTPRSAHAAAPLPDGRVLITGGSSGMNEVLATAEIYDPEVGEFIRSGDMTVVRHKHAVTALWDGKVLVIGGSDERDSQGRHASAELYDPALGAFAPAADMSSGRFKLPDATVLLSTGEVLVAGGSDRAEVYNPHLSAFRPVAGNLGADWAFMTATLLRDGRALIAGGYDSGINLTDGAWVFRSEE